MSNVLSEAKRQQVIALGRLGWPLRRIEQETRVRRAPAKPANEVTTESDAGQGDRAVNPNPENRSSEGKAKAKRAKPANAVTTGHW